MVGLHTPQVIDARGGQALLHEEVIHQLRLGDAPQVRQTGSVPQHVANGDIGLPIGSELRPVVGDGLVIGQQAPVGQPVNHRRRDTLGRREHHRAGVGAPALGAGPVGPPVQTSTTGTPSM